LEGFGVRKLKDNSSRPESLGSRARKEVKRAIMSGRFRPGEKITIRALATALNISITPAREALANLVAEGVLDVTEAGTISIPSLTKERVVELASLRECLEALAAREACKHLSDKDIEHLERLHAKLVKAHSERDFATVIGINWEFHFALYRRAKMPLLLKMIEGCWLQAGSYLNIVYPAYGQISDGIRNHQAILDAAVRRKPGELAAAIARDIELAAQSLLAQLAHTSERRFEGISLRP
jgi:DNA-binding GntR family transcriptional regulator